MAEQVESAVRIREFNGLVSHRGGLIGRPGDASAQVNLHSPAPGKLTVRKGRAALTYATAPGGSGNVLSMYFAQMPDTDRLFQFTSTGQIVVGVTPS